MNIRPPTKAQPENIMLCFRPWDGFSDERHRTPLKTRLLAALPIALFAVISARKLGIVAGSVCLAAGGLFVVWMAWQYRKLRVVADNDGVEVVGWFSTRRWAWDAIAGVDYGPKRIRFIGTYYVGRVMLNNGTRHYIRALGGSQNGDTAGDKRNRECVASLSAELVRRGSNDQAS